MRVADRIAIASLDPNLLGTGSGANLFSTNQVIFRCEARIGLAVLRPSASRRSR